MAPRWLSDGMKIVSTLFPPSNFKLFLFSSKVNFEVFKEDIRSPKPCSYFVLFQDIKVYTLESEGREGSHLATSEAEGPSAKTLNVQSSGMQTGVNNTHLNGSWEGQMSVWGKLYHGLVGFIRYSSTNLHFQSFWSLVTFTQKLT